MREEKGTGKGTSATFSFCAGNMDDVQSVDIVLLHQIGQPILQRAK